MLYAVLIYDSETEIAKLHKHELAALITRRPFGACPGATRSSVAGRHVPPLTSAA